VADAVPGGGGSSAAAGPAALPTDGFCKS
jgi:hypothetical protein